MKVILEMKLEKYKNTVNYKPKYVYEFFRRLVDVIFSLVVLIPALVLILIFSIIIRIDSKGYPIFSQVRVGKNGKLKKIHKLRSMRIDAEANGQNGQKMMIQELLKLANLLENIELMNYHN